MEKIIITRRELIRQIPADLSEHDRTVSLLNALSERLPKNAEKEDVDLQSGDFDEAFRLLNAFDPRTYGTVQLGESLREEQTDTAKEHVGVLGLRVREVDIHIWHSNTKAVIGLPTLINKVLH